jgi:hypothetical protein
VAALVLFAGVAGTALLWRHRDELAGVAMVLVTTLAASPVSWGHSWVAVYPALVLLLRDSQNRRISAHVLLLSALAGMLTSFDVLGGYRIGATAPGQTWNLWELLRREWWLVWGVAFMCWAAAPLVSGRRRRLDREYGGVSAPEDLARPVT